MNVGINFTMVSRVLATLIIMFSAHSAAAWTLLEGLGVKEAEDYLNVLVTYDPTQCSDPEYPLLVELGNSYNQATLNVRFAVFGREPNRSSNIYETGVVDSEHYASDYIIEPSQTYLSCWRVPIGYLYDFCQIQTQCHYDREARELAIKAKLERYPPQDMFWSAEIIYVQMED